MFKIDVGIYNTGFKARLAYEILALHDHDYYEFSIKQKVI